MWGVICEARTSQKHQIKKGVYNIHVPTPIVNLKY